jgi:hypothetical protein
MNDLPVPLMFDGLAIRAANPRRRKQAFRSIVEIDRRLQSNRASIGRDARGSVSTFPGRNRLNTDSDRASSPPTTARL